MLWMDARFVLCIVGDVIGKIGGAAPEAQVVAVHMEPLNWKTVNVLVEAKALVILAILVGTWFLSKATGLFVVGAVFCCLGFLRYFRCRKKAYYVITLVLAVAIWAAFRFALGVDF